MNSEINNQNNKNNKDENIENINEILDNLMFINEDYDKFYNYITE